MCRRFFKCFEKCIECRSGEHVHLVDDEHLVASHLRRNTRLLHQRLDVLHRVVRCSIQLKDVQRALLVEGLAAFALAAGFTVGTGMLAVDGLSKNTGTSGLSYTTRATEQISMCQLSALHRVL